MTLEVPQKTRRSANVELQERWRDAEPHWSGGTVEADDGSSSVWYGAVSTEDAKSSMALFANLSVRKLAFFRPPSKKLAIYLCIRGAHKPGSGLAYQKRIHRSCSQHSYPSIATLSVKGRLCYEASAELLLHDRKRTMGHKRGCPLRFQQTALSPANPFQFPPALLHSDTVTQATVTLQAAFIAPSFFHAFTNSSHWPSLLGDTDKRSPRFVDRRCLLHSTKRSPYRSQYGRALPNCIRSHIVSVDRRRQDDSSLHDYTLDSHSKVLFIPFQRFYFRNKAIHNMSPF